MLQSRQMKLEINPRMLKSEPMQRCQLQECRAACCLYGVWLDQNEWADIRTNSPLIIPHMPRGLDKPDQWVDGREDTDEFVPSGKVIHSRVLPDPFHYGGTACVFLRSDHKCALQVAGQEAGLHPWRFKPFYCVLHPLDLDEQGRITLDVTEELLCEPGSCLRPADSVVSLLETFEPELRYLMGEEKYQELCRQPNVK
jgi:hypothetical protein